MRARSTQTICFIVPAHAELDGEGNRDRFADGAKDLADFGEIAQQAGASVAAHDALGRATEIQVDRVEAGILNNPRRFGQGLRIGAEELRADGVLVVVEGQVAPAL